MKLSPKITLQPSTAQQLQKMKSTKSQLLCAIFLVLTFSCFDVSLAAQDWLPNICDTVKCPPSSEMTCPEDSDIRENFLPLAAALLNPMASETTSAPVTQPHTSTINDNSTAAGAADGALDEELYAYCCLTQKCHCRTCYIPDCKNEYDVIVELVPESPLLPGQCCGSYDCQKKPNCTEVRDTESYWLADCQRCKCHSGERICHQSCDEGMRKPTAICKSKTLNQYFEHGDVWKDGCYECECVNGEEKCVMPFCRSVNCPRHRQVLLKDSCCPICWPKGIRMPIGDEEYDDDNNKDEEDEYAAASGGGQQQDDCEENDCEYDNSPLAPLQPKPTDSYASSDTLLPDINFEKDEKNANNSSSSNKKANNSYELNTTTMSATHLIIEDNSTTMSAVVVTSAPPATASPSPPCLADKGRLESSPATYKVYPEVVEVVRQTDQSYLHYIIIGVLGLIIVLLVAWNVHLRHKQRSYRPVSNFDDSFNKMSSNIKKMNDYV